MTSTIDQFFNTKNLGSDLSSFIVYIVVGAIALLITFALKNPIQNEKNPEKVKMYETISKGATIVAGLCVLVVIVKWLWFKTKHSV